MRGNRKEPIRTVVRVDVAELEIDLFLAQHDGGALHPGTGLEADQEILRHDGLRRSWGDPVMMARGIRPAQMAKPHPHKRLRRRTSSAASALSQARNTAIFGSI